MQYVHCSITCFLVTILVNFLQVVLDNGIINVTISTPAGMITRITYNGIDNLLEDDYEENNRGYTHHFLLCTILV